MSNFVRAVFFGIVESDVESKVEIAQQFTECTTFQLKLVLHL